MNRFNFLILTIISSALSASETIALSSDEAIYLNQKAEFHGHVVVEHPLGTLRSDHALIPNQATVEAWDAVTLDFTQREGVLTCSHAVLDHEQGIATCQRGGLPITYTEHLNIPLHIQGNTLTAAFDAKTGNLNNFYMQQASGDAKGDEPLHFSAQTLDWNQDSHILKLDDDVSVEVEGKGTLVSPGPVKLKLGERSIDTIVCESDAILEFTDSETLVEHTLICPGGVCIDQRQGRAIVYGNDKEQVLFEDAFGEIFADKATIEFKSVGQQVFPLCVVLEGHVRILNRFVHAGEEPGGHMQYALADRAVYTPTDKQLVFSSKSPKRVLFYDKIRSLQVSAPKLTVRRDRISRKEVFDGAGSVRFSFNQAEMQQINQRFGLTP